jgi:hypothetical protein
MHASLKLEKDLWSAKAKMTMAFLITTFMMLSTVRVRSEEFSMSSLSRVKGKKTVLVSTLEPQSQNENDPMNALDALNPNDAQESLKFLAAITETYNTTSGNVPFLFHVPRSGVSTVKDIIGSCYGKTEAADIGGRKRTRLRDTSLKVVLSEDGAKYVNVDTYTWEGIKRSKKLGLIESGLVDLVVSRHFYQAATLFNSDQKGICFTMIRHPIERAISLFHYLGVADWEPAYDPSLAYINIEMYARSERSEHNWMVRFLSNEMDGDLSNKHLAVAKEVLQRKCLVGLLDEKDESFRRFDQYFGWTTEDKVQLECRDKLLHWGWSNKFSHPNVEKGSVVWDLLYKKNELDMQLYEYARELFVEQAGIFQNKQGSDSVQIEVNEIEKSNIQVNAEIAAGSQQILPESVEANSKHVVINDKPAPSEIIALDAGQQIDGSASPTEVNSQDIAFIQSNANQEDTRENNQEGIGRAR